MLRQSLARHGASGWRYIVGELHLKALAGLLLLSAILGTGCGPVWYADPGFAERLAKQENKPLLLYFKAWDSSQHRNMMLNVLSDASVKSELKTTVNAQLEFAFFPEFARRYGVQKPQVCVVCKPDGVKVSSPMVCNPVPTAAQFLDWLKNAKAQAQPPAEGATPK